MVRKPRKAVDQLVLPSPELRDHSGSVDAHADKEVWTAGVAADFHAAQRSGCSVSAAVMLGIGGSSSRASATTKVIVIVVIVVVVIVVISVGERRTPGGTAMPTTIAIAIIVVVVVVVVVAGGIDASGMLRFSLSNNL